MTRSRATTTEAAESAALWAWRDALAGQYHALRLMVHVPNEGKRAPWRALAEGITPGVPDILLLAPRRGYAGLAIELKVAGNTLTARQEELLAALRAEGWQTHTVTMRMPGDWVIPAGIVAEYLSLPRDVVPGIGNEIDEWPAM